jgi:small-conductance mechanosensitive channel
MPHDMAGTLYLSRTVFDVLAVVVLLVLAFLGGFALNRLFHYYSSKFRHTWGELLFALFQSLPIPLLLLAALYTALEELALPRPWEHLGSKAILVLVISVFFYFPARVLTLFLRRVTQKQPALDRVTEPAAFLIPLLFALVAVIVILENLGVHLTAVWTTLGIGSVAVALALQDTLGNFFAGLYILADRPIRPDDYIRLDSGPEGYVVRIGWRSALLRTPQNSVIVVPNSTLAKAVITNFSRPEERLVATLQVGVAYGSDARRVEALLVEIARDTAKEGYDGLLPFPEPLARLVPGFGPSTLDFTLVFQVRSLADRDAVQSELRKRILERFAREKIEMPYPTQAVVLEKQESEVRSQKTGVRSQESGARRQESGVRSQESGA